MSYNICGPYIYTSIRKHIYCSVEHDKFINRQIELHWSGDETMYNNIILAFAICMVPMQGGDVAKCSAIHYSPWYS